MQDNGLKKAVTVSQEGQALALKAPEMQIGIVPQNLADAMQLATIIARSDIVPKDFKGKPGNVLVAMQMGAELGLKPMQALQNIAVINGRPSVWGDAMLAIVKGHHSCEFVDEAVKDGVATCIAKRKGQPPVERTFNLDDAKRAGLIDKPGPWKQYRNRMLQMRARGFALRDTWPDLLRGIITSEEARDTPTDDAWKEALGEAIPQTATEKLKDKLKQKGTLGVQTVRDTRPKKGKAAAAPIQAELPAGEDGDPVEAARAEVVEGIGNIGDKKWEIVRKEQDLPKMINTLTEDQCKAALARINELAATE